MLRNFLLSSTRNFQRNGIYTVLNLLGLSLALGSVFLLTVYAWDEKSVDQSLEGRTSTYFVSMIQSSATGSREVGLTTIRMKDWLHGNNEITDAHILRNVGNLYMRHGNLTFERGVTLAGANFLEFFNYPLVHGDRPTALSRPNSILLSKSAARLFFGDKNPVGKTIETIGDVGMQLQVTGVIDESVNSHLEYDCIISWDSRITEGGSFGKWYEYSVHTYARTEMSRMGEELSASISKRYSQEFPEDNLAFRFHRLDEAYFSLQDTEFLDGFRTGSEEAVQVLMAVAFLILLIAIVNNVNISVSLLLKRVREMGVRRVLGAAPWSLAMQLIIDNLILVLIASFVGLTLADVAISLAPQLFGGISGISLDQWPLIVCIVLLAGFLSGLYPAIVSARLQTLGSLRGQTPGFKSKQSVRNVLMAVQFVITFGLIVTSLVIYRQQQFVGSKEVGFDRGSVLVVPVDMVSQIWKRYGLLLDKVRAMPEVRSASIATDAIGSGYTNNSFYAAWEGLTDIKNNGIMSTYFGVDHAFVQTYGMKVLKGRNFDPDLATDSSSILINVVLAGKLPYNEPVGRTLKLFGENSRSMTIIGILDDFNFKSLHHEVTPVALYLTERNYWNLAVSFEQGKLSQLVPKLQEAWHQVEPNVPFDYYLLNDALAKFYNKDRQIYSIIGLFALLSVILSLVGLFGLTAFSIEQRLREISIRKVLGANLEQVVLLFNSRVVLIFGITLLLSIPLSYYIVSRWLENFAYHVPNNWVSYAVAAVLVAFLLICTVTFTSLKAAQSNPVRYLKEE